jgi:hypothetical protein
MSASSPLSSSIALSTYNLIVFEGMEMQWGRKRLVYTRERGTLRDIWLSAAICGTIAIAIVYEWHTKSGLLTL